MFFSFYITCLFLFYFNTFVCVNTHKQTHTYTHVCLFLSLYLSSCLFFVDLKITLNHTNTLRTHTLTNVVFTIAEVEVTKLTFYILQNHFVLSLTYLYFAIKSFSHLQYFTCLQSPNKCHNTFFSFLLVLRPSSHIRNTAHL